MDDQEYDTQVVLTFSDFDYDPQRITDQLGIAPTRAAVKGSRNPELVVPRTNLWIVRSSPAEPQASLAGHWQSLMGTLAGKEPAVNDIAGTCDLVFTVIFSPENEDRHLAFDRDVIGFVARCAGRLEID
jgi:hypothetical protein